MKLSVHRHLVQPRTCSHALESATYRMNRHLHGLASPAHLELHSARLRSVGITEPIPSDYTQMQPLHSDEVIQPKESAGSKFAQSIVFCPYERHGLESMEKFDEKRTTGRLVHCIHEHDLNWSRNAECYEADKK